MPTAATASQFTASQIIRFSQELKAELSATGFKTFEQAALPFLVAALAAAAKDPVLATIDFNRPLAVVVKAIVERGNALQRAAFSRHIDHRACAYLPGIWTLAQDPQQFNVAKAFVVSQIEALCALYGAAFRGDKDLVAYTILQDFGAFSLLDFLLFFERAKAGRYHGDYEPISVRGLSYEYLKRWLDQYTADRDDARMELYRTYKLEQEAKATTASAAPAPEWSVDRARAAAILEGDRRRQLEQQAEALRGAWEAELYETVLATVWYREQWVCVSVLNEKTGAVEQERRLEEVVCAANDPLRLRLHEQPVRRLRPGAAARLVMRDIYEFITFRDGKQAQELFERLRAVIAAKYAGEPDPAAYEPAEMKTLHDQIGQIGRTHEMLKAATLRENPAAQASTPGQWQAFTREWLRALEAQYYDVYLPECFETKYPPLRKNFVLWQAVLKNYVAAGFPNPVYQAIFE